jgi:hypothetical protein
MVPSVTRHNAPRPSSVGHFRLADQSRLDPEQYSEFLLSSEEVGDMLKTYQKRRRKEKLTYLTLKLFPAIWCFDNRFFSAFLPFSSAFLPFSITRLTPSFERDRIRWLDRASWQSLLRVTEGKFKWVRRAGALAPPAILAFSYSLEAASGLGMRFHLRFHLPISIIITIIFYSILYLLLRACPRAIRANISNQKSTWLPVSKIDSIKSFVADTLKKEIVTIRLTARDLPHLNHALEEEVLTDHFATTGKPWPYEGLDQRAMNLVRELGTAAAKARGGIAYERRNERRRLGKWEVSKDVAERVYLAGERGPILYMAQIDPLSTEVDIQGFREDTDLSIEFTRLGRNFYLVDPDRRVEYFVNGYDLFVDERSADTVLEVVSRNESCKKPGFRVAAWFLLFLIFVISVYQLWQAFQRVSDFLT